MEKVIYLFVILLLSCNCTSNPERYKRIALKEATSLTQTLFKSLSENDTTTYFSLLSKSDDFVAISDTFMMNHAQFPIMARNFFSSLLKQTFQKFSETYVVLDGQTVLYYWKGRNVMYGKSGIITIADPYCLSIVLRKNSEGWRIYSFHESYRLMQKELNAKK